MMSAIENRTILSFIVHMFVHVQANPSVPFFRIIIHSYKYFLIAVKKIIFFTTTSVFL